jgi:hypothetical protein
MLDRMMTPLPMRMRTLRKDSRGYPVPFLVVIDKTGTPQFTINDTRRAHDCISKHLCAICGKRFDKHPVTARHEMWFVGGSRCFLHPMGAFIDPPLHLECAEYALRVCPFLAASRYMKRIDDAKLKPENRPIGLGLVSHMHALPELPECFGLGLCNSYQPSGSPGSAMFKVDDWRYVEWWRAGERIEAPATGISPPIEGVAA